MVDQKQKLSEKQQSFIKNVVRQWDHKLFVQLIKCVNQYPFLKDTVWVFKEVILKGRILKDKHWHLINVFLKEFRDNKWIFKYLDTHPHKVNVDIYGMLVAHQWISDAKLKKIYSVVKSKRIKKELELTRAIFYKFSKRYNTNRFTRDMGHRIKQKIPLTTKQFEAVKSVTGSVKPSETIYYR